MSEMFLNRFKVAKIIIVTNERFRYSTVDEMAEVRPTHIRMIENMGDISDKILYIMPKPPVDLQTGIFKIHLSKK
jgi:hypothetical protein